MNQLSALAASALLALTAGCTHAAVSSHAAAPARATPAPAISPDSLTIALAPVDAPQLSQKAGDFVVYRFSGSYRATPLTLVQRVVEVKGWSLVVDYTLKDGARRRTVRVTFDKSPEAKREIIAIARIEGTTATPIAQQELDALMSETVLAADDNEKTLGTEDVTLAVAGKSMRCTKTSYRVVIGKKKATMSTLTSAGFTWGDVGGEIRSDDGKLLYRAEIVETGNDAQ
jgi:hypothetical protein